MKQQYVPSYDNSYALVIGINQYEYFPPLSTAVHGANEVALTLEKTYGFDVTFLKDREVTSDAFYEWIYHVAQVSKSNDRVLIYFAGHGITRQLGEMDRGYLALPSSRPEHWNTMIEMDRVLDEAKDFDAKHLAYLLDCCFGGLVFQQRSPENELPREIEYYLVRRVRYAISAGSEPVDDDMAPGGEYSLFTYHLLDWLKTDYDADGVWNASELGAYLRERIGRNRKVEQMPVYGSLSGSGDFIFKWDTDPRLPIELILALRSTTESLRLGAVTELLDIARHNTDNLGEDVRKKLMDIAESDPDKFIRDTANSLFAEEEAVKSAEEGHILWQQAQDRVQVAQEQQQQALERIKEANLTEEKLITDIRRQEEEMDARLKKLAKMRRKAEEEQQKIESLSPKKKKTNIWLPISVVSVFLIIGLILVAQALSGGGTATPTPEVGGIIIETETKEVIETPTDEAPTAKTPTIESSATSAPLTPTNIASEPATLEYIDGGILYQEDFDSGRIAGWTTEYGWSVTQDSDDNYVLQGTISDWSTAIVGDSNWEDYALTFRVKVVEQGTGSYGETFTTLVRLTDDWDHYKIISNDNNFHLMRDSMTNGSRNNTSLNDAGSGLTEQDDWTNIRVEVYGNGPVYIQVFINGIELFKHKDGNSNLFLTKGRIGFAVSTNAIVWFDDIRVIELVPDQ